MCVCGKTKISEKLWPKAFPLDLCCNGGAMEPQTGIIIGLFSKSRLWKYNGPMIIGSNKSEA